MDFNKIDNLIISHASIPYGIPSMPFIVKHNEQNFICWFNMNINSTKEKIITDILEVFAISEIAVSGNWKDVLDCTELIKFQTRMKSEVPFGIAVRPELYYKREQYFKRLNELKNEFSEDKMFDLILKADYKELLPAYKMAKEYIMKNIMKGEM